MTPETGLVGHPRRESLRHPASDSLVTTMVFEAGRDSDTDADGLTDEIEFAIGIARHARIVTAVVSMTYEVGGGQNRSAARRRRVMRRLNGQARDAVVGQLMAGGCLSGNGSPEWRLSMSPMPSDRLWPTALHRGDVEVDPQEAGRRRQHLGQFYVIDVVDIALGVALSIPRIARCTGSLRWVGVHGSWEHDPVV